MQSFCFCEAAQCHGADHVRVAGTIRPGLGAGRWSRCARLSCLPEVLGARDGRDRRVCHAVVANGPARFNRAAPTTVVVAMVPEVADSPPVHLINIQASG